MLFYDPSINTVSIASVNAISKDTTAASSILAISLRGEKAFFDTSSHEHLARLGRGYVCASVDDDVSSISHSSLIYV
jgi:hypothetical protein